MLITLVQTTMCVETSHDSANISERGLRRGSFSLAAYDAQCSVPLIGIHCALQQTVGLPKQLLQGLYAGAHFVVDAAGMYHLFQ